MILDILYAFVILTNESDKPCTLRGQIRTGTNKKT